MFILTHHKILKPEVFRGRRKSLLENLPPDIRLHQEYPSLDGSMTVFVWETESVDTVKNYVESFLLGLGTNEYYSVAGWRTSALITPDIPDIDLPLPSAIAFPTRRGLWNPEIMLLTVERDGAREKTWYSDPELIPFHGWEPGWRPVPLAPLIPPLENGGNYFPALGWFYGEHREYYHWNAFFSFERGQKMGEVWGASHALYNWSVWTPPAVDFDPRTGYTWRSGTTPRLNIFGLGSRRLFGIALRPQLREFWWDGTGWRWTDHGRPPDSKEIKLGPQSAIWPAGNNNQFAYVFVAAVDEDPGAPARLWARYWHVHDYPTWDWAEDLGHPDDVTRMREPLVFSYQDAVTGQPHISVFVVGFDRNAKRWKLLNRYWHDGDWEDWESWGHPDGVGNGYGSGFYLTSGVVWHEGATLRINLFGYTDTHHPGGGFGPGTDPAANQLGVRGHLINFWWDGAIWQWGETVACPSGHPFLTASSVAFSKDGRHRISVFGRSQGSVWERYWDTAEALEWRWLQH